MPVLKATEIVTKVRRGETLSADDCHNLREYTMQSGRMWVARPVFLAVLESHERAAKRLESAHNAA